MLAMMLTTARGCGPSLPEISDGDAGGDRACQVDRWEEVSEGVGTISRVISARVISIPNSGPTEDSY
jgi:hypothetical protein